MSGARLAALRRDFLLDVAALVAPFSGEFARTLSGAAADLEVPPGCAVSTLAVEGRVCVRCCALVRSEVLDTGRRRITCATCGAAYALKQPKPRRERKKKSAGAVTQEGSAAAAKQGATTRGAPVVEAAEKSREYPTRSKGAVADDFAGLIADVPLMPGQNFSSTLHQSLFALTASSTTTVVRAEGVTVHVPAPVAASATTAPESKTERDAALARPADLLRSGDTGAALSAAAADGATLPDAAAVTDDSAAPPAAHLSSGAPAPSAPPRQALPDPRPAKKAKKAGLGPPSAALTLAPKGTAAAAAVDSPSSGLLSLLGPAGASSSSLGAGVAATRGSGGTQQQPSTAGARAAKSSAAQQRFSFR